MNTRCREYSSSIFSLRSQTYLAIRRNSFRNSLCYEHCAEGLYTDISAIPITFAETNFPHDRPVSAMDDETLIAWFRSQIISTNLNFLPMMVTPAAIVAYILSATKVGSNLMASLFCILFLGCIFYNKFLEIEPNQFQSLPLLFFTWPFLTFFIGIAAQFSGSANESAFGISLIIISIFVHMANSAAFGLAAVALSVQMNISAETSGTVPSTEEA